MMDITASKILIRFNTQSNGTELCWRLLINNQEYLVNHIDVQAPSITSKDWLEDKQEFKHHITVLDCRVIINAEKQATITPVQ